MDVRTSYGCSHIRMIEEAQVPEVAGLTKRRLEVLTQGKASWHVFNQFHFTEWRDHNLQQISKSILNLCTMVKTNLNSSKGACVVHCNDSVGRTGIFIALMKLTSDIDMNKDIIDICKTVFDMRAARMQMVSSRLFPQYLVN